MRTRQQKITEILKQKKTISWTLVADHQAPTGLLKCPLGLDKNYISMNKIKFEPEHDKIYSINYATIKDTGHLRVLISLL